MNKLANFLQEIGLTELLAAFGLLFKAPVV